MKTHIQDKLALHTTTSAVLTSASTISCVATLRSCGLAVRDTHYDYLCTKQIKHVGYTLSHYTCYNIELNENSVKTDKSDEFICLKYEAVRRQSNPSASIKTCSHFHFRQSQAIKSTQNYLLLESGIESKIGGTPSC